MSWGHLRSFLSFVMTWTKEYEPRSDDWEIQIFKRKMDLIQKKIKGRSREIPWFTLLEKYT